MYIFYTDTIYHTLLFRTLYVYNGFRITRKTKPYHSRSARPGPYLPLGTIDTVLRACKKQTDHKKMAKTKKSSLFI